MGLTKATFPTTRRPPKVKSSKAEINAPVHTLPELRFGDESLTSYAGAVVLQALFQRLELKKRLRGCFAHLSQGQIVGYHRVCLILVMHIMLGFRRLRDIDRYRDDPVASRAVGLRRMPHVSTVSRALGRMDNRAADRLGNLSRELVLGRLERERLARVTLDFDGSVVSSGRFAEGLAVGYNKGKKGMRSYYPLLCTVAQNAQVLDILHRPGNVHDSNGAPAFMENCIGAVRAHLPHAVIESRMDSAFFSDTTVSLLDGAAVEFTISVPFERFAELKEVIESRKRWNRLSPEWSVFEISWSPHSWESHYRLLVFRHRVRHQNKEPIQLNLFVPVEEGFEFKAIITNKTRSEKNILAFHNGRGSQENIFSELKSQCQMDYVPTRRLAGNRVYFLSTILAHNLFRELQMACTRPIRFSFRKRPALWVFPEAQTIRQHVLHRAGRLTNHHGRLRLTLSGNRITAEEFARYLSGLGKAA